METSWPQFPLVVFSIIALFAVANTWLANFVTASRLVFRMSVQNLLSRWLGRINPKTHTPDNAIAACFAVGLLLALSGSLSQLAGATSFLILVIFSLMNVSLILIRRPDADSKGFRARHLMSRWRAVWHFWGLSLARQQQRLWSSSQWDPCSPAVRNVLQNPPSPSRNNSPFCGGYSVITARLSHLYEGRTASGGKAVRGVFEAPIR